MLDRVKRDPVRGRRCLLNTAARIDSEREDVWLEINSQGEDRPITLVPAEPYEPEPDAPARDSASAALQALVGRRCQVSRPI